MVAGLCSLESLRDPERQNRTPAVWDSAGHQDRGEERTHKAEVALTAPGHVGHTFTVTARSKSQGQAALHIGRKVPPHHCPEEREPWRHPTHEHVLWDGRRDWESIPESLEE